MRIILKPAGTLVLLCLVAVLCFLAFNNREEIFGGRSAAPIPITATRTVSGGSFHAVDLTRIGKSDWAYYGVTSLSGSDLAQKVVYKSHVARHISPLEIVGHPPRIYQDDPRPFRWQDGEHITNMPEARTGLTTDGIGNGFRFTVTPEIGRRHTLRIWVGGTKVRSKLMARMSDGSPLSSLDESFSGSGQSQFHSLYTIVFEAKKPGQEIIVSYLVADGQKDGSVSLQAVALE
jgi:hypothetical protein